MKVGDIISTTTIKAREPNIEFSFKAPKGEMFVFLFLGCTPAYPPMNKPMPVDFPQFDAAAALRRLGWEPQD